MSVFAHLISKMNNGFPTPRFLSLNPTAIDLSSNSIKLLRLKKSGSDFFPEICSEIKIPENIDISKISEMDDLENETVSAVVDALKKMKSDFGLKYVAVSIPEGKTYIFSMRLPKEAIKNVGDAIKFSIEEYVPLSVDEINFDYFILNELERKKDDPIDVVVNAFPRKVIGNYTRVIKKAGLFPMSFKSEASALGESVIMTGDNNPYLILNLSDKKVTAIVVERGVVQYTSSINASVSVAIQNNDSPDAQELKSALNKLLVFWFTNRDFGEAHKKIETAFLVGDNADSDMVQEFFERYLKIAVDSANVWINCFDLEKKIPTIKKDDALRHAVVIGLAIQLTKYA